MQTILYPWHVLIFAFASALGDEQAKMIAYLSAENDVLREQLKARGGRIRFSDRQRRRLAAAAKAPGRAALGKLDTIVTPETLLRWHRYLIHDRDPLFTRGFVGILAAEGVKSVRLPPQSPNLNAYAERFVLSIKSECLGRLILFSEGQLRRAVNSYAAHYHHERNHQGLGNQLIAPRWLAANSDGPIECHERLGGLLRYYRREAA